MRKIINKIFRLIFKEELAELDSNLNYIKEVVGDKKASCNVDFHVRTPSWCVINLKGKKATYLKFINLNDKTCSDIIEYLRQFEECDIDCSPLTSNFIKASLNFKY